MKTAQDILRHVIPAKMWKHISGDLELIIIKAMYKHSDQYIVQNEELKLVLKDVGRVIKDLDKQLSEKS